MAESVAGEKKVLTEEEFALIEPSHYPALSELDRDALEALAGTLRHALDSARELTRERNRLRRKDKEVASQPQGTPAEVRGATQRKQVFAAALRRVQTRIDRMTAEAKRKQGRKP